MSKQSSVRRRSRPRTRRSPTRKESTLGLRLLLSAVLLAMGVWGLTRASAGLLLLLFMVALLIVIALAATWFALRPRPYEELTWQGKQSGQNEELVQLADTAQAVEIRPV